MRPIYDKKYGFFVEVILESFCCDSGLIGLDIQISYLIKDFINADNLSYS